MGPGIDRLVHEIETNFTGGSSSTTTSPTFTGLERKTFYCDYPQFDDENNLSLVHFIKCHGVGILFPETWKKKVSENF